MSVNKDNEEQAGHSAHTHARKYKQKQVIFLLAQRSWYPAPGLRTECRKSGCPMRSWWGRSTWRYAWSARLHFNFENRRSSNEQRLLFPVSLNLARRLHTNLQTRAITYLPKASSHCLRETCRSFEKTLGKHIAFEGEASLNLGPQIRGLLIVQARCLTCRCMQDLCLGMSCIGMTVLHLRKAHAAETLIADRTSQTAGPLGDSTGPSLAWADYFAGEQIGQQNPDCTFRPSPWVSKSLLYNIVILKSWTLFWMTFIVFCRYRWNVMQNSAAQDTLNFARLLQFCCTLQSLLPLLYAGLKGYPGRLNF